MRLNRQEAVLIYMILPGEVSAIEPGALNNILYMFGLIDDPEGMTKLQARLDALNKRMQDALNKGGDPDV
jgi:hypothetical protein